MFRNSTCLGVDLSGKDIKIVELRKSRNKYEVVQAARLEVGSGDIATALKHFLLETDTCSPKVVWSLPTNACSVKFARLPSTKPAETARMARYEAETQIPLPLTDLIWGYSVEKPAKNEELSHVVIGAARRSIVEDCVSSLQSAGLPLSGAMISSLAEVYNLCRIVDSSEAPVFTVNVGEEWTDLTEISAGKVTSCRSVHIGTCDLASAVAADLDVTLAEAQKLISSHSVLGNSRASDGIQQWIGNLSLEIRRSALAGLSGEGGTPVRTVILTGDGAAIPEIAGTIASRTNLTIEIGDPWTGMSLSTVVTHNGEDLPSVFSVATGLAMAGLDGRDSINLMPEDRAEEQSRRRKDMTLIAGLGTTAIVLLIVLVSGYATMRSRSEDLDNLKIHTTTAKASAKHLPAELTATTTTMAEIVKDLSNRSDGPAEILRQLSVGLPKSCWLSELRYESGKSVIIRGSALSNSSVADAVYLLSNSTTGFQSVSLDYSNLGKNANSAVYEFQIKCQLPPNASSAKLSKKPTKERTAAK